MNVEIPPAQDSPKNILNALNDDCIQFILRRLKNASDFLSAAETCVRFQVNATLIFQTQFKEIRVDGLSQLSNAVTVDRAPHFLSIFGHLVKGIDFNRNNMEKLGDEIQNMLLLIANLCGKTLKTLKLTSIGTVIDFKTLPPFEALEELDLEYTNIRNFEHPTRLKKLYYIFGVIGKGVGDVGWLIQAFPKLECASFLLVHELQHNQLIRFLELNPQLKALEIGNCKQIKQKSFENIVNSAPNLEEVGFWTFPSESNSYNHPIQFENLSKLKFLDVNSSKVHMFQMKQLIAALVETNCQIETLALGPDLSPFSLTESNISHLKSLKHLWLPIHNGEDLVRLIRNLPHLQSILVDVHENITLNYVEEALQYGKSLSVLMVATGPIEINSNDFNSTLNSAMLARVKVIIRYKFSVSIDNTGRDPNNLLNKNRKWLDINDGYIYRILSELRSHFKMPERWLA